MPNMVPVRGLEQRYGYSFRPRWTIIVVSMLLLVSRPLPFVSSWRAAYPSPRGPRQQSMQMTGHSQVECEVVGAYGRIGSRLLKQVTGSRAVARGHSPGVVSCAGQPIYVTTPSKSWPGIDKLTPVDRRRDLVWIGNGLALARMENSTFVVPHFAILENEQAPITSRLSPPTYVSGRHAATVASVLQNDDIRVETVSWEDVRVAAARKLLWATCMWLLCHSCSRTITVAEVHQERQQVLDKLVDELWPAFRHEIGVTGPDDAAATLAYLKAYSESIPTATPNKALAVEEIRERNGVPLRLRDVYAQPVHETLLLAVGGAKLLSLAIGR